MDSINNESRRSRAISKKNKIDESSTGIVQVWEGFKAVGKEKVNGEEEIAPLVQCGVSNFTGEKRFYYDFVRQFTNEDGEAEQLYCEFVFEPTKELKKLKAEKWYFEFLYRGNVRKVRIYNDQNFDTSLMRYHKT
ncbi:hypothetical protein RRU94_17785 [Domibacillus sp. DTU_2020_1001157_1_SI_ALB_TIR_016]|uniref:hypothetical protein n=1 Tax=Domibacillus sp. DTU_2020_1001157_1_SI_ALB_TIR_016 TaxID=3077789 RepID=UPI0028E963DB|nr:hypothetical protein [Domibacillus sp. DTU_2020_1001157_1_SI_ALB_TIR_016]WNS79389.1 hypothetical protein RRU94_17785 [Domibacillus sp. DTU_2020_1001157_1_SI_ALB_TIR_016]